MTPQHDAPEFRPLRRREILAAALLAALCLFWVVTPQKAYAAGVGKIVALINQLHGAPLSGTAPTNDYVMTYDSATGQWGPEASAGVAQAVALLDGSEHTDTTAGTPVLGSLVKGDGSTWAPLTIGTDTYILTVAGTNLAWAANSHTTANVVDTLAATLGAGADAGAVAITNSGGLALNDDATLKFGTGPDMLMSGETTTLGAETATRVLSVDMDDGDFAGIKIDFVIRASDAADDASVEMGTVQIALVDMAGGGVTASTPGVISVIEDVGSCVLTQGVWSLTTTDDQSIEVNVASVVTGITQTTHEMSWVATYSSNVSVTVP